MKGTEKQIAWAEDIRNNIVNTCKLNQARFENTFPKDAVLWGKILARCEKFLAMCDAQPQTQEAKWWIEHRDQLPNPIWLFTEVSGMVSRSGCTEDEALTKFFGM